MKKILASLVLVFVFQYGEAQNKQQYTNPILGGFYPDPSICRVGNDYYLVNSSFAYYPGLPLFHSRDLVSWKQIGHAMDRPEQLNLIGAGVSRGLYAPDISYHKGIFYIVCTLVDKGGNFVITATNPAGPWSNPTWLPEVNGIDPSLYFNEDDKAFIVYNSIPPDNKSLWNGHRTIRMRGFDYRNLKVSDEEKILINGGTDISKKPVWIEGPHIYKKDRWYYLMCAEGGTGYNHSEVIFKSKSVEGPFVSYERNPILTQRHLDLNRKNPITSTGHADLVECADGKWYAVFLGCRPYEGAHFNTGRETFMAPVTWENGWPIITKGNEEVQYHYPLPQPAINKHPVNLYSGNFIYKNDFNAPKLDNRFIFLRTVNEQWYSVNGSLRIKLRPETVTGTSNPSFIGYRQQHTFCEATTSIVYDAWSENEKAGLIIFQNEHHFYYLCQSVENKAQVVQLLKSTDGDEMQLLVSKPLHKYAQLRLKIESKGSVYTFSYSTNSKDWIPLQDADAKFLSTETAGGFVGAVFGMYATSSGKKTNSEVFYDWFEYRGKDEVFGSR
jgi:xylan 1,4-beta-xylosidase